MMRFLVPFLLLFTSTAQANILGKYVSTEPHCRSYGGYSYSRLYIQQDQRNPALLTLHFYGEDDAYVEFIRMGDGVTNNPTSMNQDDRIYYATQVSANRIQSRLQYTSSNGKALWHEEILVDLFPNGQLQFSFRTSERGGYAFSCRYQRAP